MERGAATDEQALPAPAELRTRACAALLTIGGIALGISTWLPFIYLRSGSEHRDHHVYAMTLFAFELMAAYWLCLGVVSLRSGRVPAGRLVPLGLIGMAVLLFIAWAELKQGIRLFTASGWPSATAGPHMKVAGGAALVIAAAAFALPRRHTRHAKVQPQPH